MRIVAILLSVFLYVTTPSQTRAQVIPEVGAQVWLEPGMASTEIDRWFAIMEEQNLRVARLFMMWNFAATPQGYNWALFDTAFASAARHKVKIVATLMPNFGPAHQGYIYKTQEGAIPKTERAQAQALAYVEACVAHFKNHPALDTWMLMNEPGQLPAEDSLALAEYKPWLRKKYGTIEALNKAWIANFASFEQVQYAPVWAGGGFTWPVAYMDWQLFWRDHLTGFLAKVAQGIRAQDSVHGIHVNPHALLDIPHRYQLPAWRGMLTSLGASIHPVWHFMMLSRPDYAMGVAYVSDLVRASSEPNPFWITELQGGHNIYTGSAPIIPTPDEIEQWLWTGAASGAKRIIFWCLNFRTHGTEAAEWGMLDYRMQPTERLLAASATARAWDQLGTDFWQGARVDSQAVIVLQSPETRFIQERAGNTVAADSRNRQAHQQAIMGVYRSLKNLGMPTRVEMLDDSLGLGVTANRRVAILPHATALSDADISKLIAWVKAGNMLVITGLSGIYEEYEKSRLLAAGLMDSLTGGQILEIEPAERETGRVRPGTGSPSLPYLKYSARVAITSAGANGLRSGQRMVGTRNRLGAGQVLWLPSCVDLAAWQRNDGLLDGWLQNILREARLAPAVRFASPNKQLIMQAITGGDGSLLTVLSNRSDQFAAARLEFATARSSGKKVYGGGTVQPKERRITVAPGQVMAVRWK